MDSIKFFAPHELVEKNIFLSLQYVVKLSTGNFRVADTGKRGYVKRAFEIF